MLTEDFPDEIIIRYLNEHRRMLSEQGEKLGNADITKGYAYINDEKTTFSRFTLPGAGKLTVFVPDEFIKDREPVVTDSVAEIANYDKSVRLLFEVVEPEGLSGRGVVAEPQEIRYSEFNDYHLDDTTCYCLHFERPYASEKERFLLKGRFTCESYRTDDWKDIFFQMMHSVND